MGRFVRPSIALTLAIGLSALLGAGTTGVPEARGCGPAHTALSVLVDGSPPMRLVEFITTNVPIPGGGER